MSEVGKKQGKLLIVSGPSGAGKSTICREVARRKDVFLSISATTRARGKGEVDGRDYWFITRQEFEKRIEQDLFLEYAEVFGNLYGTPADVVEKALGEGRTVILEIDVQGARKVKERHPEAVMIFILPPSESELASRLADRGRETASAAKVRLGQASREIAEAAKNYQYRVVNAELEKAIEEVIGIIDCKTVENKYD